MNLRFSPGLAYLEKLADQRDAAGKRVHDVPLRDLDFFEEGCAYGTGKRIIVVANRSHVFHFLLPELEFVETWPKALDALGPALRVAA